VTGYNAVLTTGAALRMSNFNGFARRLLFTGIPGIENLSSTLLKVSEITVQDTYGPRGLWVHGDGSGGVAHATWISNSLRGP